MEQVLEPANQTQYVPPFNEKAWIKLMFLLTDMQDWLYLLATGAISQVPRKGRKSLLSKTYHFLLAFLAYILEKHYYKIPRYPEPSKFTIHVPELLCYLRDISDKPATPIPGSSYLLRTINVNKIIGFDIKQVPTTYITIVTDSNGWILTAFPGKKLNNSTRKEPLL